MAGLSGIEPLNVMPVHWVDDEFGPGSDAMTAGSAPRLDRLLIGRPVDLLEIINCVDSCTCPRTASSAIHEEEQAEVDPCIG